MKQWGLIEWDRLPAKMRNQAVKPYYDLLQNKKNQLKWKRMADVILSLILIVLLSPVMAVIAYAIHCDSNGKIFFRQIRVTQYGQKFRIFKFRTMCEGADKIGAAVTTKGDKRVTKIGFVLRKYRLDEIPQLFNVIKGEMTFVGTRPEVPQYVNCYTNEMLATLLLPAGITSLASIKFKEEETMLSGKDGDCIYINRILPEKMKWNLKYIKTFCFMKDFKIMMKTIAAMIF